MSPVLSLPRYNHWLGAIRNQRWLVRLVTFSLAVSLLIAASLAAFWPGRNAAPGLALVMAQQPRAGNVDPFGIPRANVNQADPFAPDPIAPAPNVTGQPAESKERATSAQKKSSQSATDRIEAELTKETSVDFVEVALKDVATYLSQLHHIPIVLKMKKLEEASISPDTPVTKSLRGIQLGSVLNLILQEQE